MTSKIIIKRIITFLMLVFFLITSFIFLSPGVVGGEDKKEKKILVYCAVIAKKPIEEIVRQFQKETGITVEVQYGACGVLLSQIQISQKGDMFIPVDERFVDMIKEKKLAGDTFHLAGSYPIIAVQKGNPKNINSIDDLLKKGVRFSLANPQTASVGRIIEEIFQKEGKWQVLQKQAVVSRITVAEVANDVKMGIADAGIIWDSLLPQYPELIKIESPVLSQKESKIIAVVLQTSQQKDLTMRFAQYLSSPHKGLKIFKQMGYRIRESNNVNNNRPK